MKSWFEIENINEVDTPVLVVFPDRVQYNIEQAISMVGKVEKLRPHVKTHKSPDISKLMLKNGINKFKCATIAEAEMLGQVGAGDVILAYQPLGPKLKRLLQLIRTYPATHYSCLVDNEAALNEMAAQAVSNGLRLNLYLDINIGMNRTGIEPNEANKLYQLAKSFPQLKIIGLHAYDGHIREKDMKERTAHCDQAFQLAWNLKQKLESNTNEKLNLVCGGSLTFPIHAQREGIECSPGTFVYWDQGFSELYENQKFLPAAVLLTRVISKPAENLICTDLGHKSVASENEISKRIQFLNAEGLKPIGQSEEHLVLENHSDYSFKSGEILYGLPYHICPTVALYERVLTAENYQVTGEWKTIARDRKISI